MLEGSDGLGPLGEEVLLGFNWLQFALAGATWGNGLTRTPKPPLLHEVVRIRDQIMVGLPLLWLS